MAARHAFILAGSLWETARFFLVITLLVQIFRSAGDGVAGIVPWLLLAGSGNLLVAAGGIMLSLFPGKYGELIGFLRLGKVLSIFSFLLLVLSGAIGASAGLQFLLAGPLRLNVVAVLFAVFILDLLFLAALIAWRRDKGSPFSAVTP